MLFNILLEAIDWNRTFQRLVVYAHRRSGCRMPLSEAEDVAAKAICQFLDPEYADWDPERQTLLLKLGSIVNGLLRNRTRTKATSAVLAVDFMSSPVAVLAASESPGPETRAMDGSEARRAFKLLEEELKGDECGENVLLLECDGMTEPRMQAEASWACRLAPSTKRVTDSDERERPFDAECKARNCHDEEAAGRRRDSRPARRIAG